MPPGPRQLFILAQGGCLRSGRLRTLKEVWAHMTLEEKAPWMDEHRRLIAEFDEARAKRRAESIAPRPVDRPVLQQASRDAGPLQQRHLHLVPAGVAWADVPLDCDLDEFVPEFPGLAGRSWASCRST